ncbi:MAG: hypothetical protein QM516_10985 [Limnohabitans sp.]|nr:hypothetical protein [Limnohabitans sp.]
MALVPFGPNCIRARDLACLAVLLAQRGPLFAQGPQALVPQAQPAPAQVAPAKAPPSAELGGYRLPLLREGSVITRVLGDLAQDPDEKLWLFRPFVAESGGLRREFVLLPCPTLEDMLRTVRLSPSPVEFELTGRVFIYRGRNFVLPELAPPIVRFDAEAGSPTQPSTKAQPTPSGDAKFVPPVVTSQPKVDSKAAADTKPANADAFAADDAAVDAIEKRLEERVGRIPARPAPAAKPAPIDAQPSTPAVATGTRFTLRRGRLLRDPQAGSWRFVPEQVTGSGDPSLEILPCLLLEKLELAAREGEAAPSILLSGSAYAFEGKSYLLPTSFRRAREGRGIGR